MNRSVLNFWQRLHTVKTFSLRARTEGGETGWNGDGQGEVRVAVVGDTIVFYEKGVWRGQGAAFSNAFRWTLSHDTGTVALEHLRLGADNAVFICSLAPAGPSLLTSVEPHLCREDTYSAEVTWDASSIRLTWRIDGPKKHTKLEFRYA